MTCIVGKRSFAKRMRGAPTMNERALWQMLRNRRLETLKFRRQVPIGPYVVDFLCLRHRLIVEADGPFHDDAKDAIRDTWLTSQGFRVLRFANKEIEDWPFRVMDAILAAVAGPPVKRH
jgi:very-short-patch-repair endonuclease